MKLQIYVYQFIYFSHCFIVQGIITLKYAYAMIKKKELTEKFPLITILYQISFENKEPSELIKAFMTSTISPINY